MQEKKKRSLKTVIIIFIMLSILLIAFNYAKHTVTTKEITYNLFVRLLNEKQISKVTITNENILIIPSENNAEYKGKILITPNIHDDNLVSQLQESEVKIEDDKNETRIMSIILNWIVLAVIIFLFWRNLSLRNENKNLRIQIKDLLEKDM